MTITQSSGPVRLFSRAAIGLCDETAPRVKLVFESAEVMKKAALIIEQAMEEIERDRFAESYKPTVFKRATPEKNLFPKVQERVADGVFSVVIEAKNEFKNISRLLQKISAPLKKEEIPFEARLYGWKCQYNVTVALSETIHNESDWANFLPLGQDEEGKYLYAISHEKQRQFPRAEPIKPSWRPTPVAA